MAAGDWNELIFDSLLEIGVKEAGGSLDTDEAADSLRILRGMLAQWGIKGLMYPGFETLVHDVTVAKNTYTLGPPAEGENPSPDIELSKPIEDIYTLSYRYKGQQDGYPINETSFAVLSTLKALYANNPRHFVYDPAHPLARLLFDRLTTVGDQFTITYGGHFANIEGGHQTNLILPEGYRECVRLNLALKLAPSFGVKTGQGLSRETIVGARDAMHEIERRNARIPEAKVDPALRTFGTSMVFPKRGIRTRI